MPEGYGKNIVGEFLGFSINENFLSNQKVDLAYFGGEI